MTDLTVRYHALETLNKPHPLRINPWGENLVICIRAENADIKTDKGIYIPAVGADGANVLSVPSAGRILKVSERVTDEFPTLKRVKQEYEECRAKGDVYCGPFVAWNSVSAREIKFMGDDAQYVEVHARHIIGDFEPPVEALKETAVDPAELERIGREKYDKKREEMRALADKEAPDVGTLIKMDGKSDAQRRAEGKVLDLMRS